VPTIFKEFKLTIDRIYDCPDDDVVAFEQTSRGVFAIDDSEYANRYMMIFGFRDGKICSWTEYYDSRIMTEKMGPILAKMAQG
jgi:ketosteroid isomerase-like protein